MFAGLGLLFLASWSKPADLKESNTRRILALLGGCLLVPMPLILGAWFTRNDGEWYSGVLALTTIPFVLFSLALVWLVIKRIRGVSKPFLACIAVVLVIITGFLAWVMYETLIEGTTSGPDFISAIQSGSVAPDTISSIEVVEPVAGYTPFTAKELDSLPRRVEITSPASISRLVNLIKGARPGRESREMNHPSPTYRAYLKVNTKDGFFWLYCTVEQDWKGAVFDFDSNTRNATNPNGASSYYLESFSEVLTILEHGKNIERNNGVTPLPRHFKMIFSVLVIHQLLCVGFSSVILLILFLRLRRAK